MPVHLAYSPATPEYPPTHVQGSRKHEATSREQHPKRSRAAPRLMHAGKDKCLSPSSPTHERFARGYG